MDCRQAPHDGQAGRSSSSGRSCGSGKATGNERPRAVLQLDEVTLVDVDVVRFLNRCETEGVRREPQLARYCAERYNENAIHDAFKMRGEPPGQVFKLWLGEPR